MYYDFFVLITKQKLQDFTGSRSMSNLIYYELIICDQRDTTFSDLYRLFISPSGTSELDFATIKKDRAERSISIGRESLEVFFVLGALAYLQVPPLGGCRD